MSDITDDEAGEFVKLLSQKPNMVKRPSNHSLMLENVKLMKALETAREYVELDAINKKYPKAIEVLATIDDALSGAAGQPTQVRE